MTNLKNLRSFITSCSHLKIYVSIQESNEMQHSEVKWSFLMDQDSHVGFLFFQSYQQEAIPKKHDATQSLAHSKRQERLLPSLRSKRATKMTSLQTFYDGCDCLLSSGKRNRRMNGSQSRGLFPNLSLVLSSLIMLPISVDQFMTYIRSQGLDALHSGRTFAMILPSVHMCREYGWGHCPGVWYRLIELNYVLYFLESE